MTTTMRKRRTRHAPASARHHGAEAPVRHDQARYAAALVHASRDTSQGSALALRRRGQLFHAPVDCQRLRMLETDTPRAAGTSR